MPSSGRFRNDVAHHGDTGGATKDGADDLHIGCVGQFAGQSLAIANTDRIAALKQEAERAGIPILPPDVNASGADFTVERMGDGRLAIRYALAAVKKVGVAAMESVVAIRGGMAFALVADFAARVDPRQLNRMQLENLIRAGTFDRLEANRARLFAGADMVLRRAQSLQEEAETGQIGLFGGNGPPDAIRLPDVAKWPGLERLSYEPEAIGFHLTAHPLDAYGPALRRLGVGAAIKVWLAETASVPHIRDVLARDGAGKGRVVLVPMLDGARRVEIALPGGFQVTPRLAEALLAAPGVERVEEMKRLRSVDRECRQRCAGPR